MVIRNRFFYFMKAKLETCLLTVLYISQISCLLSCDFSKLFCMQPELNLPDNKYDLFFRKTNVSFCSSNVSFR